MLYLTGILNSQGATGRHPHKEHKRNTNTNAVADLGGSLEPTPRPQFFSYSWDI